MQPTAQVTVHILLSKEEPCPVCWTLNSKTQPRGTWIYKVKALSALQCLHIPKSRVKKPYLSPRGQQWGKGAENLFGSSKKQPGKYLSAL